MVSNQELMSLRVSECGATCFFVNCAPYLQRSSGRRKYIIVSRRSVKDDVLWTLGWQLRIMESTRLSALLGVLNTEPE